MPVQNFAQLAASQRAVPPAIQNTGLAVLIGLTALHVAELADEAGFHRAAFLLSEAASEVHLAMSEEESE